MGYKSLPRSHNSAIYSLAFPVNLSIILKSLIFNLFLNLVNHWGMSKKLLNLTLAQIYCIFNPYFKKLLLLTSNATKNQE